MRTFALSLRYPLLAAALALSVGMGACNMLFGIEGGELTGTSTGGAAGSTASTSGAAGTGATGGLPTSGGTAGTAGTAGSGGTTSTTSTGSILDGLSLLLHMDEAAWSGADAVIDASGNGNHGTVSGTVVPTPDGKIGGAGLFDGGGWIVVPDSPTLHPDLELTCAVWVYPTGLTDGAAGFPSPGIVSKREAFEVNVAFTLFLWEDNNAFVDIQADRFHSAGVFSNGAWAHIAFVYDGNEELPLRTRIYINGVLDSVHASDPTFGPNTQDIQVGGLPGGGEPFIGKLDEVAIWRRALTADEIKSVYDSGLPP